MTTCVVSGEALDSMGKPYVFTYEGQEVQLCCMDCKKTFDKNPEEYMNLKYKNGTEIFAKCDDTRHHKTH